MRVNSGIGIEKGINAKAVQQMMLYG